MQGTPTGFASANISKGFILVSCLFSLISIWTRSTSKFNLDLSRCFGSGEVWRLLTSNFVFSTPSEAFIGTILLYNWRLFERQYGVRKFGAAMLYFLIGGTAVQCLILLFSSAASNPSWTFSSGPYALIYGLLVMYFLDIPSTVPFTLFGFPLSEKLFIYLLSIQLAVANIPQSCYTVLIGLFLGLLYHIEALRIHRLRIPEWLSNGCGAVFSPLLSGSVFANIAGVQERQGRRLGGSGVVGHRAGNVNNGQAYALVGDDAGQEGEVLNEGYAAPALVAPNPQAVAQLQTMGFTEQQARAALAATGNDITAATNRLVG